MRPVKNKRRIDPRYFLNESAEVSTLEGLLGSMRNPRNTSVCAMLWDLNKYLSKYDYNVWQKVSLDAARSVMNGFRDALHQEGGWQGCPDLMPDATSAALDHALKQMRLKLDDKVAATLSKDAESLKS